MNKAIIHALDSSARGLAAVCRTRVTTTSDVARDPDLITCEACRLSLTCPACGWPIPVSTAAAMARGRRYHIACASKLELEAPSSRS
jgi:hypothetical protein